MEDECNYGKTNGCPYLAKNKNCNEEATLIISGTEPDINYHIKKWVERIVETYGIEFGQEGKRPRLIWKLEGMTHACLWTKSDSRIIDWERDNRESFFDDYSEVR